MTTSDDNVADALLQGEMESQIIAPEPSSSCYTQSFGDVIFFLIFFFVKCFNHIFIGIQRSAVVDKRRTTGT